MLGFILRWAVAFGLLAATFNPTEWNYTRWAQMNFSDQMPLAVFLGLLLAVGYIVYLRATLRSIGALGMALVLAVAAALLWVLYDYGFVTFDNPTQNTWLGLVALSLVLGIGLSWSHVRRKLSGQADMDDVDE
jgi:drug/metabolite transporter (DMT)-like permease